MDMQQAIRNVTEGNDLSRQDAAQVMRVLMEGMATPGQMALFWWGCE